MDRRKFLGMCLKGGVSMAALTQLQLQAFQGSTAIDDGDYKALVCVFLSGGNDSLNMLVPLEGEARSLYESSRQNLAIANPLALAPETSQEGGVGLHNSLAPLQNLFAEKQLAFVTGVGSLIAPTTQQDVINKSVPLPLHLFSHNKQQATWMYGKEQSSINTGWGARLLERLEQAEQFGGNISLSGMNHWQTSVNSMPFSLSTNGISQINALSGRQERNEHVSDLFNRVLTGQKNPLGQAYGARVKASIDKTSAMNLALQESDPIDGVFSGSVLSRRLRTIARTISIQSQLGCKRQVFYVSMGGFDTHGNQNRSHASLLGQLSQSLSEFNQAMTYLGQQNNVTTFTMSEFGRTLTSNGNGTDHGWAGNHIVMGGAVNGGDLYGKLLTQHLNGPRDTRGGRLIPDVANEQYFATLARWFGVPDSELVDIFPNLANFNQHTLGFM